ncbi:hypothetical protein B296_00044887 [Ensete ventricosum]|uniref:Uncharacterized protein n=1 Tax=Ensete ventricosum TaxID=4639 RepID=A0A426XV13_ENSVE|nr:hypothetical protein B296_00044887 [Ensete ventricosum]
MERTAHLSQLSSGWAVHLKHVKPFYCAIMACDAGRLIAVSGGNGEEAVVKEAALPEGGRMWPELKGEGVYDAHSKDGTGRRLPTPCGRCQSRELSRQQGRRPFDKAIR